MKGQAHSETGHPRLTVEFRPVFVRHRYRYTASFVPAILLLGTLIGAGSVLAGIDHDGPTSLRRSIPERPSAATLGQTQDLPSHASRDCKDLSASFLNPACHSAEPRKHHAGHLTHRLAAVVIGRADTDLADALFPRQIR